MGLEGAIAPADALNGAGAVSGPVVSGEMVDTTSTSTHSALGLEERRPPALEPGNLEVCRAVRPVGFHFTMRSRLSIVYAL
jgi:hypothetical protein